MALDPKCTRLLCVNPGPGAPGDVSVAEIISAIMQDDALIKRLAEVIAPHLQAVSVVRPT